MKIWSVFSVVIVFHLAILGLLLVQPGCQSQPKEKPDPAMTSTGTYQPDIAPEPEQELDPAFNAGITTQPADIKRSMRAPSRPTGVTRSTPDTGMLESVLEPVRDGFGLPSETRDYTVSKGDTLSGIARKNGVSLSELMSANGLSKNSTIFVGQTLQVPAPKVADETRAAEVEHSGREVEVRSGDTLSAIAARIGTTVKALKALNGLRNDTIFVGQRLAVPEGASVPVRAEPARRSSASTAGQTTYVVQAGDTPSGIARKFGTTSKELMAVNGITDARKLYVGKELVIPVSGSASTFTQPVQQPTPTQPATQSGPVNRTLSSPTPEVPTAVPSEDDPMSMLEALEDEDLPFVEVEAVDAASQPGI